MIAVAAVAASAMAANADTVTVTQTVNGVEWRLMADTSAKTVSLGPNPSDATVSPHSAALAVPTSVSGAVIAPETFSIDGDTYTVTQIGNRAFRNCSKITSLLFQGNIGQVWNYGVASASSLNSLCFKGPVTVAEGGSQSYATLRARASTSFEALPALKFVLVGPNVKLYTGWTGGFQFYDKPEGTTVIIPSRSGNNAWDEVTEDTIKIANVNLVRYGPDYDFDMTMGDTAMTFRPKNVNGLTNVLSWASTIKSAFSMDTKVSVTNTIEVSGDVVITDSMLANVTMEAPLRFLSFTPTTANALTNVLAWAPSFMTRFGLDTRISVTNTIDLTGVTITDAMVSGVTFDRLMFTAKTQAQLNAILGAFPATTPISIDPTGLTENMVIPETYNNVHVKTVPGVTIKRTTKGFMLIVK